jgi:N-acetylglucosaminyldiphosphoundecaprenol N-acetyl-beta-D-mannosaminyltransferase
MTVANLTRIEIMGIPVTVLNSYAHAVRCIVDGVNRDQKISCVAITPEKIYRARRKKELKEILRAADLCICDGAGTAAAARLLHGCKIPRITGIQLFFDLVACAEEKGLQIFLLGATPESNEEAYEQLKQLHPKLHIAGRQHGYFSNNDEVISKINDSGADMLFIAMGSPRQEKWMATYRRQIHVPYCMGVGGVFDVLSGHARWAPRICRKTGTEWLYRLILEPRRFQRNALVWLFALGVAWRFVFGRQK